MTPKIDKPSLAVMPFLNLTGNSGDNTLSGGAGADNMAGGSGNDTIYSENRYDNDRPRSLAMEAKYEVLHAMHLAKLVKMTDDKVMTSEELIL